MTIKIENILKIDKHDYSKYKLHLASWNGVEQPLNVFVRSWDNWLGWNEWRGGKDDFNRERIFSLIEFYHEPNKWLFGGIFEIKKRFTDFKKTEIGYELKLMPIYEDLIGRLVIDFTRYQGMRGRSFRLENYYEKFSVSEVLKSKYDGALFPGYENINVGLSELENIIKLQKSDWKSTLENIKGIYLIADLYNGKKYVGSAYGKDGIWARWSSYINSGHGSHSDELTKLIKQNGIAYARKNFQLTLLENFPMKTEDTIVLSRESHWKSVLMTRAPHGYNKN